MLDLVPLLGLAKRRDRFGDHGRLTEAEVEVERVKANVRALLDNNRPSEAINLLEDGIERAGHDPFLALQLRHLLGAALFYAGEYTRAASLFDVVGRDSASICRRPTLTSSTAPTPPATPTPRSASRTRPCPS